jgi:adenylate cyclase, class 2
VTAQRYAVILRRQAPLDDIEMPRNIEIKIRHDDLADVRQRALVAGATDEGALFQTDTFFRVSTGRLKLREIQGKHAELIAYSRDDIAGAKSSDYVISPVADVATMLAALSAACRVTRVVRKRRDLLLWRNVRVHLDRVEGLGSFVELESVVGEVDEATAESNLQELMTLLALEQAEVVAVAYADLLEGVTP